MGCRDSAGGAATGEEMWKLSASAGVGSQYMKPLLFILMSAALIASPMQAQDEPKRPGGHDPAERLKMMTEKLGLTPEQQEKVKAVNEKYAPQLKEIISKGRENITDEDRAKMKEIMKSQSDEIAAILTEEQKQKWQEMRQQGPGGDKGGKRRPGKAKSE